MDDNPLALPVLCVGLSVPVVALFSFVYFMIRDPQRLQSEEFVIEQQRLMIESKGGGQPVDASTIAIGSNPEIRFIGGAIDG